MTAERKKEKIVLNYQNSLLRSSDVNLLTGPYWLNDLIISFYMEYLEADVYQNNKDILFVSPEVVQCIKLVSKEEMSVFLDPLNAAEKSFIFFPLNDNEEDRAGGHHWSLLVFSRPEQTFFYFDSLNSSDAKLYIAFIRDLAYAVKCPEFDIKTATCAKQTNSYDCGVYVLCFIELLAKQVSEHGSVESDDERNGTSYLMKITPETIRFKRLGILNLIIDLGGTP